MLQKDTEGLKNKNEMAKNWACDVGGLGHLAAIATAIVVAIAVALAAKRPKKIWPPGRYSDQVAKKSLLQPCGQPRYGDQVALTADITCPKL